MAVAIACAPVIYPWYLLYFTPFLLFPTTLPLLAWCGSVLMTYVVWERALDGGRWIVPEPVVWAEYAVVLGVTVATVLTARLRVRAASGSTG